MILFADRGGRKVRVEQCFGSKWALSGQFASYSYRWLQMAEHIQLLRLPQNCILSQQNVYRVFGFWGICGLSFIKHLQIILRWNLLSAMHNVLFVQYVFLPTKQAETYSKIYVLMYHLTYICTSLFDWRENMIYNKNKKVVKIINRF